MALATGNRRELQQLRRGRRRGIALLVLALVSYLGVNAALIADPDLTAGQADHIVKAGGWLLARALMILSLLTLAKTAKAPAPVLALIVALGLFPLLFQMMALVFALTLLEHRERQARGEPALLPSWTELEPDFKEVGQRIRTALGLSPRPPADSDDGPIAPGR